MTKYEIQRRDLRSDMPLFSDYSLWMVWEHKKDFIHFVKSFENERAAQEFVRLKKHDHRRPRP